MPLNIIQKVLNIFILMPEISYFTNNNFENTSPCMYRPATLEQTWFFYKWPSISASLLAIHSAMTGGVYVGASINDLCSSLQNCDPPSFCLEWGFSIGSPIILWLLSCFFSCLVDYNFDNTWNQISGNNYGDAVRQFSLVKIHFLP